MSIVLPIVRLVGSVAFDKSYLNGKWFDTRRIGWIWVLRGIWFQKVLGFNRSIPVPISPGTRISNFRNLVLGKNNLNNLQSFGVYFQNYSAKIYIGDDTFIAPNVGFITANHDPADPTRTLPGESIRIGDKCWIGMNSVILPGVTLGPSTIVGAGSVVTRSFTQGNCIIAGNPARNIKDLQDE